MAQYRPIADPARRAYAGMITAMDTEIGRVIAALDASGSCAENTIVVFQSDNGGPHSAKFTGEVDMSKSTIPPDNGPFREGKGTLYEGGTRVVAVVNWPGRIAAGLVVDQPIHIVDMFPTLAGLAGAPSRQAEAARRHGRLADDQPGQAVAAHRGGLQHRAVPGRRCGKGTWKLIWRATLPSRVELFDIARDPSEKTNLAEQNPEVVAELKQRIEVLSRDAVPPLILAEALPVLKSQLFGSVVLPEEARAVEGQP